MIVTFLRSSSIGTLAMCEMQYFFQYVLGYPSKSGKKAVLGTITHRVMQALGDKKIAMSKGLQVVENDDILNLTLDECDNLEYVNDLCFEYYKKHERPDLTESDKRTTLSWVYKALSYDGGSLDPRNQDVYATELFFDFEIKKPWAKYSYTVGDEIIEGYLGLKGTIDLIIQEGDGYFQVLDYKGLPINTPIPTPDGWSTMGDLKVGDVVFDQYGQRTKVIAKSTQKFKECYRITFDDTSIVECDDEHYWKLEDGTVVQVGDLTVGDKINTAKPIDCEDKELPIDPYVLGLWLGDGRNRSCEITSGDSFIFSEIERRGYSIGVNQEKRDSNCELRTIKNTTSKLRDLNLLHNKHIPSVYLRASYSQRLDLLRGLMDSDGTVNTVRKQCVFMNCRKELSEDVKSLLLTLGQRPLISDVEANGFGVTTRAYPVSFRPININPFLLPVKRDKINAEWGPGWSNKRRIVNIEKIETKLTQCISVDSPDHTYLCTKNMIPTHNTGKRLNWATGKEKTQKDLEKDPQLLLYYYALKNMYPDQSFYMSIYYINDGGLFDIIFTDDDYVKAEQMIKHRFEYIKSVEIPRQISRDQSHWKCQKLCEFSKLEKNGKTTCQNVHDMVQYEGIKSTTEQLADLSKINAYGAGGGRLEGGNGD